jgi:hypothetical protein
MAKKTIKRVKKVAPKKAATSTKRKKKKAIEDSPEDKVSLLPPVNPVVESEDTIEADLLKLSKSQEKYLEKRIEMCIKAYPHFTREQAREWLLKNNVTTKVIR